MTASQKTEETAAAHVREGAVGQNASAGLPFAAAAAFRVPDGSAAVMSASPGEVTKTQTAITTLPDGSVATTVVTTTTVTTTTTTTTTTQTFITGEMPPIQAHQLEASYAPAGVQASAVPSTAASFDAPAIASPGVSTAASAAMPATAQVAGVPVSATDYYVSAIRTAAHAKADYSKPLGYRFFKRLLDIAISAIIIVIAFIPGLIVSIAVMASTKGTPFYLQERVGRGGQPFRIVKFRTMVADADDLEKHLTPEQIREWHAEHKVENDPRITKLGGFLRRTSIDEFPNFLNVLIGQMSIVGPRAITIEELPWFGPDQAKLLSVPAGVTGWWQVSSRNAATFETGERQKLELYYVDHASLSLDVRIFFKTFAAVFSGTGK